ncbi:hypothetical protein PKB_5021 [Pseudomonas knackmussii B13]|uniref:Secreted protein n=1 Tax=Pseudomonas knackmussii (strain DSM 6978 / CCUG 54928 / LMG 23759 / B13) TaxID=1301098 RepID=A0A024HNU7_PSEKB|nr:hypothetical protein PKB_5021 [Pseudomonas knackmussii B13]
MLSRVSVACLVATLSGGAWAEASSQSAHATFDECQATQSKVITQLNVPPSDIVHIVNTSQMTVTRICTADGSVLISCSAPDEKIVITRSDKSC